MEFLEVVLRDAPLHEIIHRVDQVFDATEHLKKWGTHPEAQEQFRSLYPSHVLCLEMIERQILQTIHLGHIAHVFMCGAGHHRSVVFVELAAAFIKERNQDIIVNRWHLDHCSHHRKRDSAVLNMRDLEALPDEEQQRRVIIPLTKTKQCYRGCGFPRIQQVFRKYEMGAPRS